MLPLLLTFSWQEWRHHPWRTLAAVVAVMLGVALAFAVHLINASALDEFARATSQVQGQPDVALRSRQGLLPDTWLDDLAARPGVALASPVLELPMQLVGAEGERLAVRVIGVDALKVAGVSPALMPRLSDDAGRLDLFAPDAVFANAAAERALEGWQGPLQLQQGLQRTPVRRAGHVGTPGAPLLVMDIAALQDLAGQGGWLSRVDLRLQAGQTITQVLPPATLPPHLLLEAPAAVGERSGQLSRAYRVNLTVLALVALFTGAFLVFSVLALSVARRQPQLALLGVLGLTAGQRQGLVMAEATVLGTAGSAAGLLLGTGLAWLALRLAGGDLGGGYFSGVAPTLQWSAPAAGLYGVLGVIAALVGGWWPARSAAGLAPAQALKGLGSSAPPGRWRQAVAVGLLVLAMLLALLPPVAGIPLAAYVSVALLLLGGVAALPVLVGLLLDRLAPWAGRHVLPMLAVERSRRLRQTAAVATSGVVASLALSVALTVMVASFRDSVTRWLDTLLPAPLYVRLAGGAAEGQALPPALLAGVAALPQVQRLEPLRTLPLLLDPQRPAVTLIVRPMPGTDRAAGTLPMVSGPLREPLPPGTVAVYASEAMVDLHGARLGADLPALANAMSAPAAREARYRVVGIWRDYARQHGSLVIDRDDFIRLSGDTTVHDLAIHPAEGTPPEAARAAIEALAEQQGAQHLIEFAQASQIRAISLRIFDRSFAVTTWLQMVAIGIGLFGVAASFSAQVLARQREFGLLAHLGLTRRQILGVVALEGLAWTALGALAGLLLGLAVSVVLVHVVNPQSFHWTMDLVLPWLRLIALCAAVVLAGTATAWIAGRAAASRDAVQAVKQDW
ncbi:FtsX-like permease family protein [Hydrogenophaga sp. R2]|uniref:FtsX-like permease family protein n=1 Tax=Hydrogenophaga sp. R2 TaxID=3132827 RepID=UPI003CEF31EC